jgi:hypothetical protein
MAVVTGAATAASGDGCKCDDSDEGRREEEESFSLPGGTVGYPAHPRLIRPSVYLSIRSLFIFLRKIVQAQQIW